MLFYLLDLKPILLKVPINLQLVSSVVSLDRSTTVGDITSDQYHIIILSMIDSFEYHDKSLVILLLRLRTPRTVAFGISEDGIPHALRWENGPNVMSVFPTRWRDNVHESNVRLKCGDL